MSGEKKMTAEEIVKEWKRDPSMPRVTPLFAMKFGDQAYEIHQFANEDYAISKISVNEKERTKMQELFYMNFYTLLALRVAIDKALEDHHNNN
jgi:hypothetical protein